MFDICKIHVFLGPCKLLPSLGPEGGVGVLAINRTFHEKSNYANYDVIGQTLKTIPSKVGVLHANIRSIFTFISTSD